MPLIVQEQAAPGTPATGYVTVYAKTDGLLYGKDDAGTETKLSNAAGITLGTPTATTSGSSIDITGIPSGTKRITVCFSGVSTSGTSNPIIQLGDSGGPETTGYVGSTSFGTSHTSWSSGILVATSISGATIMEGIITIVLLNSSTNLWCAGVNIGLSNGATAYIGGGSKALSAELDRIRLTTAGGSDTFDAGSINIAYEG